MREGRDQSSLMDDVVVGVVAIHRHIVGCITGHLPRYSTTFTRQTFPSRDHSRLSPPFGRQVSVAAVRA